jgi:hypothetical protein
VFTSPVAGSVIPTPLPESQADQPKLEQNVSPHTASSLFRGTQVDIRAPEEKGQNDPAAVPALAPTLSAISEGEEAAAPVVIQANPLLQTVLKATQAFGSQVDTSIVAQKVSISRAQSTLNWIKNLPKPSLGMTATTIAMVPQAVFAGLLSYEFLTSYSTPQVPAAILAGAVTVGVEAGKVVLLEYLGRNNWKTLSTQPILTGDMSLIGTIELIARVNASATFAYLSYVAWADPNNGLGQLLRQEFSADSLANTVETPALYVLVGCVASFICNMLSFVPIHKFGSLSYLNLANHLLSKPKDEKTFLEAEHAHIHGLNQLIKPFNELVKAIYNQDCESRYITRRDKLQEIVLVLEKLFGKPENAKYQGLDRKEKILALLQKDRSQINLMQRFQEMGRADEHFDPRTASVAGSKMSHMLGAMCIALSIVGLCNFFDFGRAFGYLFFENETLAYACGIMAVTSMSIMAGFTSEFGIKFGDRLSGKETREYPNILSSFKQKQVLAEAIVVCWALGGLANGEQAKIVGQNLAYIICAIAASALLETFGWFESRYSSLEQGIIQRNEFKEYNQVVKELLGFIQGMKFDNPTHPGPTLLTDLRTSQKKPGAFQEHHHNSAAVPLMEDSAALTV